MNNLAKFISWVFHPVWLGWLGTFLIFRFHTVLHSKLSQINLDAVWLLVFMSTAVLPVISGMLITGIRDFRALPQMNDQHRRTFMVISAIYLMLLLYMFVRAGMHYFVLPFYVGSAISLGICALANLRFRMSLHALGWGGLVAMLLFLLPYASSMFFYVLILSLLISGLVLTARLWLKAHSRWEVYSGFLSSAIIMTLIFILYGYRI